MSKQNDQLEDILDELSVIKESVETYNTKLANIEALLSQQVSNESEKIESESSTLYIPENLLKEIVRQGLESYFNNEGLCSSILSDERIKLMGDSLVCTLLSYKSDGNNLMIKKIKIGKSISINARFKASTP